jgi:hypothetical protein
MNLHEAVKTNKFRKQGWLVVALFVGVCSAYGQTSFAITPLVGGLYSGSVKVEQDAQPKQDGQPDSRFKLDNAFIFGVAGGVHFDGDECAGCEMVQFRWMRQKTHLNLDTGALNINISRPSVTIDHFLLDFAHEWPIE